MAMTTRCPQCGTTFKVVPDQLRVRNGLVRCGECATVFDGRACLVARIPDGFDSAPSAPATASMVDVAAAEAPRQSAQTDLSTQAAQADRLNPADQADRAGQADQGIQATTDISATASAVDEVRVPAQPQPPAVLRGRPAIAKQDPYLSAGSVSDDDDDDGGDVEHELGGYAEMSGLDQDEVVFRIGEQPVAPEADGFADKFKIGNPPVTPGTRQAPAVSRFTDDTKNRDDVRNTDDPYALDDPHELDDHHALADPHAMDSSHAQGDRHAMDNSHALSDRRAMDDPDAVDDLHALAGSHASDDADARDASQDSGASVVLGESRTRYHGATDVGRTPPEFLDTDHQARRSLLRSLWGYGCILGLLLLAAQLIFVYRSSIADMSPQLRPLLTRLCEPLGCEVGYARHIDRISITSSSLQPPAGQVGAPPQDDLSKLVLRASLRNLYNQPQPWPALRLDLSDLSDTVVIRKILLPEDYLPKDQAQRPFAPGAELNIAVPIQVSGPHVNGFQLHKFFP